MEELRRRLLEDLSDAIEGELRVDRTAAALYSTDASLYEIEPVAVAFPRRARDVEVLAAYSADHRLPLIARGAGSGLAGGAIGRGLVIDFSRHMNQVLEVRGDTVRVQPGVVRDQLNRELRKHGRYFPPDPSNSRVTTVGGMLGVDAAGSHAVRIGSTRDHVASLECVLSGGQRIELGREPITSFSPLASESGMTSVPEASVNAGETLRLSAQTPATRRLELLRRLDDLLVRNESVIRQHQPALLRNCAGYMLRGIRRSGFLDLPRLLVGSEGTLGIFTEATLYTMPLPAHRSAMLMMFRTMDQAVLAMQLLLPLEPSACDLLDRRLLSLGRGTDLRFRDIIDSDAEAALIVEFPGSSQREVQQRLSDAERLLSDRQIEFHRTRQAVTYDEVEFLWSLPAQVVSLLASLKGTSRPLPFVEDVAVPPDRLAEFLTAAQRVFQRHEVTATLYSHAASGQIHFRPILAVPHRGADTPLESIARELYRHVVQFGGTISGEHGDGLSRTAFLRTQYGPLYRVFQQLKDLFDPLRLMNPDKIISNDPQLTVKYLRATRVAAESDRTGSSLPVLQLGWTAAEAADAAVRCNGCAGCRTVTPPARMCPFVPDDGEEELTPRGKAALLRRSLCNDGDTELLTGESVRRVLDSCFNCKQCQLDCPSEVDIPHLVLEARAQHVQAHGLNKTAWLLSRVHTYAPLSSRFAWLTNRALKNPLVRKFVQRFFGIAATRRLPPFAPRPYLESQRVLRSENSAVPGSPRPTVVYFVDYFANYHDPELAEAFVRILEHNGFRVFIPRLQTVSGMSMVTVGDFVAARAVAEQNIRELIEPAREGFPILCTEPSAALCLTQEYPLLIPGNDADIIAQKTTDAGSFLAELSRAGRLKRDFTPRKLTVAWHTPCHSRALRRGQPYLELLSLIPDLTVVPVDKGCTGMAGMFGLSAENFDLSLRIGSGLISQMQTVDAAAGATDCSSCRMQMEQSASIPTLHPLKLLAMSYGLMPRLEERLAARPAGLSMS